MNRKEYMAADCTTEGAYDGAKSHLRHQAYFEQFVNDWHVETVLRHIGAAVLLASRDLHLNDVPLAEWDRLPMTQHIVAKAKEFGDNTSLSTKTCVYKAAARQWLAANSDKKLWPIKYCYPDRGCDGGPHWFNRSFAVGRNEEEALENFRAVNRGTVRHELYMI